MPDSTPRFTEVAPQVWVAHYDWMHVNITLIGGSDGLLMVDTHGSAAQARIVADDVRRLGAGPLTGLVNTHEHWDHHFGNATLVEEFGPLRWCGLTVRGEGLLGAVESLVNGRVWDVVELGFEGLRRERTDGAEGAGGCRDGVAGDERAALESVHVGQAFSLLKPKAPALAQTLPRDSPAPPGLPR